MGLLISHISFLLSLQQITKVSGLNKTHIISLNFSVLEARHHIAQLLLYLGFHKDYINVSARLFSFMDGQVMSQHANLFRFADLIIFIVVLDFIKFLKCLIGEDGWILLSASKNIHYILTNYLE